MYIVVIVLVLISFSLGLEHYVMTGIIQYISHDLNISLAEASYLNSIYFVGVVISGPIMILLIRNLPKFISLSILAGFIVLGNFLIYLFPTFNMLVIGRILASFSHSAFFGISAVLLYQLSPNRKGLNIQLISFATTLANSIGVPISVGLSQAYGWHVSFLFVALSAFAALILMLCFSNSTDKSKTSSIVKTSFKAELRNLFHNKSALSIMFIAFLNYISFFITISFLSVIITEYFGFPDESLPKILMFIGAGMIAGGFLGALLYDRFHSKIAPVFLVIALIILSFSIPFLKNYNYFSIFGLFLFELLSFSLVPYFKTKIISKSLDAPNLVTTLNNVLLGLGSALGAVLAGKLIEYHSAVEMLYFSGIVSVTTLGLVIYNYRLDRASSYKEEEIEDLATE